MEFSVMLIRSRMGPVCILHDDLHVEETKDERKKTVDIKTVHFCMLDICKDN